MKRVALIAAVTGVLALPAMVSAKPGHGPVVKAAVHACIQERKDSGREAFVDKYGRPALPHCVRQTVPEARNAAQECRDEQALDPAGFTTQYGSGKNGRNAFGKCVSSKVSNSDHT